MTHLLHKILLLLCGAMLLGCQTGKDEMPDDRPLSNNQIESALARRDLLSNLGSRPLS